MATDWSIIDLVKGYLLIKLNMLSLLFTVDINSVLLHSNQYSLPNYKCALTKTPSSHKTPLSPHLDTGTIQHKPLLYLMQYAISYAYLHP